MGQYVSAVQLHSGDVHMSEEGTLTVDPDGLIAFYPVEGASNDPLYDEARDEHHGNITGAKRVAGTVGDGLYFEKGDLVEIPAHKDLNPGFHNLTYCFFIRPEDNGTVIHKQTSEAGYGTNLEDNMIKTVFQDTSGESVLVSNTVLSSGDEYFIAIVRDAGSGYLYIDAMLEDETHAEYDIDNTNPLILGDAENGFHGLLDEIYFYDRALSERELTSIYEMYTGSTT